MIPLAEINEAAAKFQVPAKTKDKYGFKPAFNTLEWSLETKTYEKNWETRLAKQIPQLPNLNLVIRETRKMLEDLLDGDKST